MDAEKEAMILEVVRSVALRPASSEELTEAAARVDFIRNSLQ